MTLETNKVLIITGGSEESGLLRPCLQQTKVTISASAIKKVKNVQKKIIKHIQLEGSQ
jgi:hypothetical protein